LNTQPTSMIPVFVEMTNAMCDSAETHLQSAKIKRGSVDKTMIKRARDFFEAQKDTVLNCHEQCRQWRSAQLNERQIKWLDDVESNLAVFGSFYQQILSVEQGAHLQTGGTTLSAGEVQLAIEFLSKEVAQTDNGSVAYKPANLTS